MKVVAINAGPRKRKNTDQMLDAFLEGVKEAAPDAEIQMIRLYDYKFKGCISCFSCQLKNHRSDLQCWVKDDVTQLLRETYHADGIVFASPIYYSNVSAQLRLFWERLMYPGPSDRKVPTALIYTMNAGKEHLEKMMSAALDINSRYIYQCFHMDPEVINSCDTFLYNENESFTEEFRAWNEAKWKHHEEQFDADLQNAREAGSRMVKKIEELKVV